MQLVTGGTGHIGNVLVRQLLERGERVRALVRPGKVPIALQGLDVELFPGDVLDAGSLVRAMEGVEVVYHLAARISFASGPDPAAETVNLEGTRNILAAVKARGVRRLIYASSIYALHLPPSGIVDESQPFDPLHTHGAYDRSKAAASLEVQQAAAAGLDALIVCPTAVAGPFDYQRSQAGRGILYYISPGIKFHVPGAYDFVDVRDVANGLVLAAENGIRAGTYILGGNRVTLQEVLGIIRSESPGWHADLLLPGWVADIAAAVLPLLVDDPIVSPYALAAVRSNSYISHAKATRELGFQPRPAREAIIDAVRWWQGRLAEPGMLAGTTARAGN